MTAWGDLPREIGVEAALRDLRNPDPRVRAAAAAALDRAPPERVEEVCAALRDSLDDGRGEVRYAAALSLRTLGDRRAVGRLLQMLEDQDVFARQAAAMALGRLGDATAVAPLVAALRDGPADVRFQAIPSLAEIGDPAAVSPIREALGDPDAEVRANAAAALGDLGAAEALEDLARLLADPDETVRFEAAYAMARLSDLRSAVVLADLAGHRDFGPLCCATLGQLLSGAPTSAPEQRPAREALRRAWRRRFAPPLLRLEAAAALVRLGEPEAWGHVCKAARSRRPEVRGRALERMGELGGPGARDLLVAALGGPSGDAAARGLARLGDPTTLEPLRRALEAAGDDPDLREEFEAAIAQISQISSERSVPR